MVNKAMGLETNAAVLALIAEMQAKLAHPDSDKLTKELATLTMQSVLPMLQPQKHHGRPL